MAKKKEPSMAEALNNFKETMHRASLSDYLYVNNSLITISPKGYKVIIVPEKELWLSIIQDDELKKEMTEADISNPDDAELSGYIKYAEDLNNISWINLDSDVLYRGKIIKIKVHDNFEYEIPINKDLLPLKLKKAEYKDIAYRIFVEELTLCIKKKFDYPIENSGFTMLRIFSII